MRLPVQFSRRRKKPSHFAHRSGAYEFEENTPFAFKSSYEKGIEGFDSARTWRGLSDFLARDRMDQT
jgi:glycerophosphoryl diester phosphodiesterase